MVVTLDKVKSRTVNDNVIKELVRRVDTQLMKVSDPTTFPICISVKQEIAIRGQKESDLRPPTKDEVVEVMNQYHAVGWGKIEYQLIGDYRIEFEFNDKTAVKALGVDPEVIHDLLAHAAGYEDDDGDLYVDMGVII